jgi:hypothetical protein
MGWNIKLLPVLIVCLIGALAYLGVGYYWQNKRQASLIDQIETGRTINSLLPTPAADLQAQLVQVQSASAAVTTAAAGSLNSTEIIDSLLTLADACHLKVSPVSTQAWTSRAIGAGVYNILPVQLTLQGRQSDLVNFIGRVEDTAKYPSLAVENLVMAENSDAPAAAADSIWSAQLILDILNRIEAVNPE